MCDRCGGFGATHAVSLSERPAHRLVGWFWEGSHARMREGALKPLLLRAREFSTRSSGLWRSPIVALSWSGPAGKYGPGGLRCFAGIAGEDAPQGGAAIDLPEMTFASSWHGPEDGSVVEHYARMIEWIGEQGLARDAAHFGQREEYPNDHDPDGPLSLRLLLPVGTLAAG